MQLCTFLVLLFKNLLTSTSSFSLPASSFPLLFKHLRCLVTAFWVSLICSFSQSKSSQHQLASYVSFLHPDTPVHSFLPHFVLLAFNFLPILKIFLPLLSAIAYSSFFVFSSFSSCLPKERLESYLKLFSGIKLGIYSSQLTGHPIRSFLAFFYPFSILWHFLASVKVSLKLLTWDPSSFSFSPFCVFSCASYAFFHLLHPILLHLSYCFPF